MSDEDFPPIDPTGPEPEKKRSKVWMRAVLFVSLALNLLIVGLVVGAVGLKGRPDNDGAPRLRDAGLGPIGAVLTREQQRGLREELKNRTGDLRQNRAQMRRDLQRLLSALRSDPFDAKAVSEVFEAQRVTVSHRAEIGHQVLIDAMNSATSDERKAMADRLEKALSRARDRNKKDRP